RGAHPAEMGAGARHVRMRLAQCGASRTVRRVRCATNRTGNPACGRDSRQLPLRVALQHGTALADVWTCEGRVAAVRLAHDLPAQELTGGDEPLESLGAAGTRVACVTGR